MTEMKSFESIKNILMLLPMSLFNFHNEMSKYFIYILKCS